MGKKTTKALLKKYKALSKKMKRRTNPIVLEENLSIDGFRGLAYTDHNVIKLDKSLSEKEYLYTLLHELAHLCFPTASEAKVLASEKKFGNCLWAMGYRRVITDENKKKK